MENKGQEEPSTQPPVQKVYKKTKQPVRLYTKAIFTGYRRGQRVQHPGQALLELEGVHSKDDTTYYMGKRVAYVYKAKKARKVKPTVSKGKLLSKSKYRCVWGKIIKAHGNSGKCIAKFRHNLPSQAIGHSVRVMLYPSTI